MPALARRCLALLLLVVAPGLARAQALNLGFPVTDGNVLSLARDGETLYMGGAFAYLGTYSGHGLRLRAGNDAVMPGTPRVVPLLMGDQVGNVSAVIGDGAGGWYIGGVFDSVGAFPRANLAHILADGSVAAWNFGTDGPVVALAIAHQTLYVGGQFSSVGGQPRTRLAAFNLVTGALESFAPALTIANPVSAIASDGATVWIGGPFTVVAGQPRNRLAAFDTSGVLTAWNPGASGQVVALALHDSTLYAGGGFVTVAGQARSSLAAFNTRTGALTSWNPNAGGGAIATIVPHGSSVYVGGTLATIGAVARHGIAEISAATGVPTAWQPLVDGSVLAIAFVGNVPYVGGAFLGVAGVPRFGLAALDPASGAALAWNPSVNTVGARLAQVNALAAQGDSLYAGGTFHMVRAVSRNNLAAIDAVNGAILAWNPSADAEVDHVNVVGTRVMAGGEFVTVGGLSRPGHAEIDGASGAVFTSAIPANDAIDAIVSNAGTLYLAGRFTQIGGQARNHLAAVDATTFALLPWNPNANAEAHALAFAGGAAWVAGDFTKLGTTTRNRLAALDLASGALLAPNPNPSSEVHCLLAANGMLDVGGTFTTIGGLTRPSLAALDPMTGLASAWNPHASGDVSALVAVGNTLYVGGTFTNPTALGGATRYSLGAVDATTGLATAWNPALDYGFSGSVAALVHGSGTILVGGSQQRIAGAMAPFLSAVYDTPLLLAVPRADDAGLRLAFAGPAPQPVHARAELAFTLPAAARVELELLDIAGRHVRTLLTSRWLAAGPQRVALDARDLAPGVYLARLRAGALEATRRVVIAER